MGHSARQRYVAGQTTPSAIPSSNGERDLPVYELDSFKTQGATSTFGQLPFAQNAGTLFGPYRNALETPRSVSILSEDLLAETNFSRLDDLSKLSSNTATPNTFGLPSLPRIRGQEGEIFQNGIRRAGGNNGFGLPLSFNSVERIDVVKGPATPVLGPTRRVGGYVNLRTKRPNLEAGRKSVTGEFGSYDRYRGALDASVPIKAGRSAIRLSLEHLDAGSFYDFVETKSDSIYLAYSLLAGENTRVDLNVEYYDVEYSDNGGWNRPTQDLIDNGTYITGVGISPVTSAVPGPAAVISPTGTVRLPRSRVLTDPDDFSRAETFILQSTIATRRIPNDTVFEVLAANGLNPGLRELRPGVFVSPATNYDVDGDGRGDFATSDTNETDHFQAGLFHQHDVRFGERWSALAGARLDLHHVEGRDPIAADGFSIGDSITKYQSAANFSLNFAPATSSNYYLTYSYSESASSALGGGFAPDGAGKLRETDFQISSELYEIGAKHSLFEGNLYLTSALFDQSRSVRNRDGSNSRLSARGAELELNYQPNSAFLGMFGVSYTDAHLDNQSTGQGTGSINDAFDDSRPDIIAGTGIGSPSFAGFPPADHRLPGLPRVTANALARYTHESGAGASLGAVYTGEQNLDVLGRVAIPEQISLNLGLFYLQPAYQVRLDVFNLTDEENFSPIFNGFFGADLVFPEQPRRAQLSVTFRF